MIISFNGEDIECSDEYSKKDFTNQHIDIPDGTIVYNSCFVQEAPNLEYFRPNMTGCTFLNCNLEGVTVPESNTVTNI